MIDLTYDTKKHAELLEMIDKKKTQRAELEEQIQALNETVVGLADKYDKYVSELPGMRKERSTLNDEINTLTEQYNNLKDEYDRLIAQKKPHYDLSVEITTLKNQIEVACREKEHLDTLVQSDRAEHERINLQMRVKNTRIDEIKGEIQDLETTLEKNARRFRQAEDAVASLKEQETKLFALKQETEARLAELDLQNLGVGSAVRKIQAALDKKGVKFDAMKALQA